MNKRIAVVFACIACAEAWGQGILNFANAAPGLNAPIYSNPWPHGGIERCSGPYWVADLYFGPEGTTEQWLLTPLGQPATFLTEARAGYFIGGARTIPGIYGGSVAVLQVRVWNLQAGATWEQAMSSPFIGYAVGWSSLFNVTLAALPNPPPNLTGLESFGALWIPEPAAGALVLAGGLVFAFRKRTVENCGGHWV
jgi:hypothetical protein